MTQIAAALLGLLVSVLMLYVWTVISGPLQVGLIVNFIAVVASAAAGLAVYTVAFRVHKATARA